MTPAVDPREHRAGIVGTVAVHLLIVAGLVLLAFRAPPPPPVVYAVNLVAAPAPRRAPARAAEAAAPTARQPEAPPDKAPPRSDPAPPPPPAPPQPARDAPTLTTRSEVTPLPDVTPSTGTDELTFTQAGIRFQDQAYLDNIVTQVRRRWSNPVGRGLRLRVDVTFTIHRDGSVSDIAVSRPSTNFTFNTSARGAIERAAREKAFGPLPDSFNGESLPISFAFTPEDR